MKIEKINENQIRCTLTREDLEKHQIRISELAYGSDKAKKLFHDMMQQAQMQFGFEADNIPLMIEAIPVNMESIILIITKVEDPEELDTRFSKFAPFKEKESTDTLQFESAANVLDMIQNMMKTGLQKADQQKKEAAAAAEKAPAEEAADVDLIRLYTFRKLDDVITASHALAGCYDGINALYKTPADGKYQLVLHQSQTTPEDFNKVCNILSEYAKGKSFSVSGEAHFHEHAELITAQAVQALASL
ncbi:MAG: adaptor protein MecA [Clostridiales bacterium]|nr:adaptor protein MecA [Candidatus Blautia equi]